MLPKVPKVLTLKCPRCGKKFVTKTRKVYLIRRKGEMKEQITEQKAGDKIKKVVKKVPADPFMITRDFKETLRYPEPPYDIEIVREPLKFFCQRCKNINNMIHNHMKSKRIKDKYITGPVNPIPQDLEEKLARRIAKALFEGRIKPQEVKKDDKKE